jgi:hypothetical protein
VRYVLEGSVRKGGNRMRITAQLIDGVTENHICAERYDRELVDIFAVQDDITRKVVGAIEPRSLPPRTCAFRASHQRASNLGMRHTRSVAPRALHKGG